MVVPDAHPSMRIIRRLRAPLLSLHGEHDDIVPLRYGEALFAAAPEPKQMHVFPGVGHDLVTVVGRRRATVIATWARGLDIGSAAS